MQHETKILPLGVVGDHGWLQTEIGRIGVKGFTTGDATLRTRVYFRDELILRAGGCSSSDDGNLVYLSASHFSPILTVDELQRKVEEVIRRCWSHYLVRLKQQKPLEEWVDMFFDAACTWGCVEVFNDVDLIPRAIGRIITEAPYLAGYEELKFMSAVDGRVTREDVESGRVQLVMLDDPTVDNMAEWFVAYRAKQVVVRDLLHSDHWIHRYIRPSGVDRSRLTCCEVARSAVFRSPSVSVEVVFCSSFFLEYGDLTVQSEHDALYFRNRLYVPVRASLPDVIRQVHDYHDENDRFDDAVFQQDVDRFAIFLACHRGDDPARSLSDIVKALQLENFPAFRGKTFQVHIGKSPFETGVSSITG